ncbi:MAG: ABC transporter substrate-binding protein [Flavobacteriaceae bacterium]|nr:ABC transporter substrate-binding protein [Flavobacteriaceae bacterium]MDG2314864.1 ABC transporter substrate-binding protein [Flavobacteriaceae bacterium]
MLKPLIPIVIFLSLFWGCTPSTEKQQENNVFRYNEHRNISSLDPAFARNPQNIWPVNQLFNGLVQLDDSLKIQGDIAHKWTISEGGIHYDFYLKKGVYFHPSPFFKDSTRTVVADDFVYSFNRLKDPKVASPGGWVLQQVSNYKALNDSVFRIELKQPFSSFLGVLSMKYCAVVPHEVVNGLGTDFSKKPIGTGPFLFKNWKENLKLVLRKNNRYFEKDTLGKPLPYLEAVAITFLEDKQSEFMAFVQGNIDFLNSLDPSYKDELLTTKGKLQPRYENQFRLLSGPYLNTEYMGLFVDENESKFESKKLRQAINMAIDRKQMVKYLRNNIGYAAHNGFVPKGLQGSFPVKGYEYRPLEAKKWIADYLKKSNKETVSIQLATDANYLDLCKFIQQSLQKVGLEVAIDVMPVASMRQAKSSGKLEMFRASWIADYPDAENYFSLFYSKNFSPSGPNYTHFKNATFDQLYQQALKEKSVEKRQVLYNKMDEIIVEEAPVIPLYYDKVVRFTQKNVTGLGNNPINILHLKRVKKISL